MSLHEARFQERAKDGRVRCVLCPHHCTLAEGRRGICGVRLNRGGVLHTLVYDRLAAVHLDPIEKKPLFHFLPGSLTYSVATVGCNLRCAFCQNWEIAQWRGGVEEEAPGQRMTAEDIVQAACDEGAQSVACTYTEPTVFYELAYEVAVLARERRLRNVWVSCGFTEEAPLRQIAPLLDAVNVDLKFGLESRYRRVSGARLEPVLEAIRLYRALGVWVEVTTLIVPGLNDSTEELETIARFLRSVGPEIPWHVTRFHPCCRMLDRPVTPLATLQRAREIGAAAGLRYLYEGNTSWGAKAGGEDTCCAECGRLLIERRGFEVLSNAVRGGCCPQCHTMVDGVGMDGGDGGAAPL